MDLGLRGRVAIVAAASKGLGRAVAAELAREGAELAICARTGADLKAAASEIHAVTGRERKRQDEPDHQRHGGHALEINERLDANPPDLLEIAGTGNAMDHDTEHDRRHDHGDQLQKRVAENLQADREVRRGDAQDDTQEQGRQDLNEQ